MTDDAIIEALRGKGSVPLGDLRRALEWNDRQPCLLAAVRRLEKAGKVETTEPWKLGFSVRLVKGNVV